MRNLNFEPAKKAAKRGECSDKMFAGAATEKQQDQDHLLLLSGSSSSPVSHSVRLAGRQLVLQSVAGKQRKQRKNSAKQWHKKHEKHTLHAPSPRGLYTHTHTRTHMETITKRRLKPFGKGRQERTKLEAALSLSQLFQFYGPSVVSLCLLFHCLSGLSGNPDKGGGTHDVDNIVVHMSSFIVSGERCKELPLPFCSSSAPLPLRLLRSTWHFNTLA